MAHALLFSKAEPSMQQFGDLCLGCLIFSQRQSNVWDVPSRGGSTIRAFCGRVWLGDMLCPKIVIGRVVICVAAQVRDPGEH